jgi:putative RNA 2'-phosphotransferase
MDEKRLVKISKYLSRHLRHRPEDLGLTLEQGGWVAVDTLLAALKQRNMPITCAELEEVVAENSKQRFSFDDAGARIRANQGHSVEVDLELEPQAPPPQLYHGTGSGSVELIERDGLLKMGRHHVHLSLDTATARAVGARHGKPVLFLVDAAQMHADGFLFFCSANGVWLVDHVPPRYVQRLGA